MRDYGRALLELSRVRTPGVLCQSAAGGRSLGVRIQRMLSSDLSSAKSRHWLAAGSVLLALTSSNMIRVEMMAQVRTPPEGDFVAAPDGPTVRLGTTQFRHSLQSVLHFQTDIAFAQSDRILVSSGGNVIRCWHRESGRLIREIATEQRGIVQTRVSRDRRYVASLGLNSLQPTLVQSIKIWEIDSGDLHQEIYSTPEFTDIGQRFEFTSDGTRIVVGDNDGTLHFYNVASGKGLSTYQIDPRREVRALTFSPDGKTLAVSASNGIYLWEWQSERPPTRINCRRSILSLAFSPNSKTLAAGPDSRKDLRLWNVETAELVGTLTTNQPGGIHLSHVQFSPDGKLLFGGNSANNRLRRDLPMSIIVWDVASRQVKRHLTTSATAPGGMAVSEQGDVIAAFAGSKIRMWDLQTGRPIAGAAVGHEGTVTGIRFAPHGRWVATSGWDGSVRIWNCETGRQLRKLTHNKMVRSFDISADGSLVASSSMDGRVRLWRSETGEELFRLVGHGQLGGQREVVFTQNDSQLVSWGDDMMLRSWDLQTRQAIKEHKLRLSGVPIQPGADGFERDLEDMTGASRIHAARLSRNGARLVIVTGAAAYVFDSTTGREIRKMSVAPRASAVALSPTSTKLLMSGRPSGNGHHPLRLIDVTSGKGLWKCEMPFLDSKPVAFSEDGSLMAAVIATTETAAIKIWDARTELPSENLWQTSGASI